MRAHFRTTLVVSSSSTLPYLHSCLLLLEATVCSAGGFPFSLRPFLSWTSRVVSEREKRVLALSSTRARLCFTGAVSSRRNFCPESDRELAVPVKPNGIPRKSSSVTAARGAEESFEAPFPFRGGYLADEEDHVLLLLDVVLADREEGSAADSLHKHSHFSSFSELFPSTNAPSAVRGLALFTRRALSFCYARTRKVSVNALLTSQNSFSRRFSSLESGSFQSAGEGREAAEAGRGEGRGEGSGAGGARGRGEGDGAGAGLNTHVTTPDSPPQNSRSRQEASFERA